MVGALWRRTKARRDDAGLLVACQPLLHGRVLTLNAVEGFIASVLDTSLAKSFNGSCPTCVGLGDALVDPMWTIGVGFEHNLSTSNFLARFAHFEIAF